MAFPIRLKPGVAVPLDLMTEDHDVREKLRRRLQNLRPDERMDDVIAAYFPEDKPIAFMFGLPLNAREAMAHMAYSAGTHTDEQRDLLVAWLVKMTLVHGSWVQDTINFG